MQEYALIGHPVEHSMSPIMHNRVFQHLNLDCEYTKVDVTPDALTDFMKNNAQQYNGLNVTIPHKKKVLEHLDLVSKQARLIGAVNTIENTKKGLVGHNTDGIGCINALVEAGENVSNKRVVVLGAGGASKAVCFQLALEDAKVVISNRSREKAVKLSQEVGAKTNADITSIPYDTENLGAVLGEANILINATSVGMSPKTEDSPIEATLLHKGLTVMDIVYNPVETRLLKQAKQRGCKVVDGVGMLVHQGAHSLRIWLGIDPPVDLMRQAALEGLRLKEG